jgi:periplasmic copper chaperone A
MRSKLSLFIFGVVAINGLWCGIAAGHVTVSPSSVPRGADDVILTFRVPNESTTASVVGLRIQFPLAHPIVDLNPEAGSSWTVDIHTTVLPKPVTTDDGTFTSAVSEIDWSGGSIPVGQFGEFNVLAQGLPTSTHHLTFKAVQLYSDGTAVDWIQVPTKAAPDPEHPAPTLSLTAPATAATGSSGTSNANANANASASANATAPTSATLGSAAGQSSSSGNGLAVAAIILAAMAIGVAILAVWLGRPRFSVTEASRKPD